MILKNARMRNVNFRTRGESASVAPVFYDDFETYDNEDAVGQSLALDCLQDTIQNGYRWRSDEIAGGDKTPQGNSSVPGTGGNGTFTRTTGSWAVDLYAGAQVRLDDANSFPITGSPFTVVSNTETVMTLVGDATGAVVLASTGPRVSDSIAHSGSQSLRLPFRATNRVSGGTALVEATFGFPAPLTEFWLEYQLHVPANYSYRHGAWVTAFNKFMILWLHNYGVHESENCGIELATITTNQDSGGCKLRTYFAASGGIGVIEPDPFIHADGPVRIGAWNRIRIHYKSSSALEVADGIFRIDTYNTTDGALTPFNKTNGEFYPVTVEGTGYNGYFVRDAGEWSAQVGYPYYFYDISDTLIGPFTVTDIPSSSRIDFVGDATGAVRCNTTRGLNNGYLMGSAGTGFDEITFFHIDDFKIYAVNPGW